MRYEILGNSLPVVVCHLNPGEAVITESGSMSWMSPNMQMETNSGGGMKKAFGRLLSGESIFQNRYTPQGGEGLIAFASRFYQCFGDICRKKYDRSEKCISGSAGGSRVVYAFPEKAWKRLVWR